MDTVRWVIKHYGIDANRVYLCGNSMGGSGALGIGMRHGDVFAAVKANVPAKVEHVSNRMYFPPRTVPADVTLPDPPIVVDYSAQNDGWSQGHDGFVKAMNERKYALFFYWGPFGHANNHEKILQVNDLINSFDWLSVKKDDAYPVFTKASTNDPLPWPDRLADKKSGQVNAFFRWKDVRDGKDAIEISLFLIKPSQLKTTFTIPTEATADVGFAGSRCCTWLRAKRCIGHSAQPAERSRPTPRVCVTVPQLKITAEPAMLTVGKAKLLGHQMLPP